jgi:imidazole glycerol-phosphate synthase subunit HisH
MRLPATLPTPQGNYPSRTRSVHRLMPSETPPVRVAIVDYGLGNLFSVRHACTRVGMDATITSDRGELLAADVVLLPGVGAFGDAMHCLRRLDLVEVLREIAHAGRPLMGICLGMQLLMTRSFEFGEHEGLDLVPGQVVRFHNPVGPNGSLKVPQVGWNRIHRPGRGAGSPDAWEGTPLAGLDDGEHMYFVHSYYVCPDDPRVVLSGSRYGQIDFCSSLRHGNVFAFQFHPERSGPSGLRLYENIIHVVRGQAQLKEQKHAA